MVIRIRNCGNNDATALPMKELFAPQLSAKLTINPNNIDVGQQATFAVNATGGSLYLSMVKKGEEEL